jgi:hypothetical protein
VNIMSKCATLLFIILLSMPSITIQQAASKVQLSDLQNPVPAIEWQENYNESLYDNTGIQSASNVIQTSDGGYAFMDLGWSYQFTFIPSTVFKVDSSGPIQWRKIIEFFKGSTIIQTNDEGYELAGYWSTYGTTYELTPTLLKTNSEGNIEWVQNYTTEPPNLGIDSSQIQSNGFGYQKDGNIQTSDGGFVYWKRGTITKTDTNNDTQWTKNLTYPTIDAYPTYTYPLSLFSVIETSDGALAALGVGYDLLDNPRTGKIYLIKTEAFLPLPAKTTLPAPIQPSSMTPMVEVTITIIVIVVVVAAAGLLFYFKKRK